jgi:hypothetical protein
MAVTLNCSLRDHIQCQYSQTVYKLSASIAKLSTSIAKGFLQPERSNFLARSNSPLETSLYFACLRFFSARQKLLSAAFWTPR